MTFNSEQNKGMLWSILVENGVFNGIDESFFSDVKSVFENGVLNLEKKQDDLINLNKEFIQVMLSEIPKFKEKQVNKKIPVSETFKTSDQIKSQRIEELNLQMMDAKNDFQSTITLNKPEEIKFNDKETDEFSGNLDEQLASAISSRNLDIEQMALSNQSTQKKAEEWIGNKNSLPVDGERKKKKVSFKDQNSINYEGYFKELVALLKQLNEGQKTIISLLEKTDS